MGRLFDPAQFTPVFTVATLPASGTTGQMIWVSDAITTIGTGDFCFWSGSQWRTRSDNITPTTSMLEFFRGLTAIGVSGRSSRCLFFLDEYLGAAGDISAATLTTGSGANAGQSVSLNDPEYGQMALTTGGTSTGSAIRAYQFSSVSSPVFSGRVVYFASKVCLNVISNATNEFSVRIGLSNNTVNPQTNSLVGAEFVYDRANAQAMGISGDNWHFRTAQSGATLIDTGIAASTANIVTEILVGATSGQALAFINGNLVATIADATVPTGRAQPRMSIVKSVGTAARQLAFDWQVFGVYFPPGSPYNRLTP